MKDNKSPGVNGIPHKLLLEIVEQISILLATVFLWLIDRRQRVVVDGEVSN